MVARIHWLLRGEWSVFEAGIMTVADDAKKMAVANEIEGIAASLFGAVYADGSLDTTAQESMIRKLMGCALLCSVKQQTRFLCGPCALGAQGHGTSGRGFWPEQGSGILGRRHRAADWAVYWHWLLDRRLARMIRDFPFQGLAFLILASVAILLGTFAFVINASKSDFQLGAERVAVYFGILCAAAACLASWGLSQGASAATTPTIAASFDTSATPRTQPHNSKLGCAASGTHRHDGLGCRPLRQMDRQ